MERRHFEWDGCLNARDLGGLPTTDGRRTRDGVLLRGDTTCGLTTAGQQRLLADGVNTIVDLRGYSELERQPNPFVGVTGPRYLHRPFNDATVEERIAAIASPPDRYVTMIDANGGAARRDLRSARERTTKRERRSVPRSAVSGMGGAASSAICSRTVSTSAASLRSERSS